MMTIYENSVYLWRFYEFVEFQSKWFLEHILKLMRKALRIRKTMFNWIFMLPKLVQLCSDVCANSRQYDQWSRDRHVIVKSVKNESKMCTVYEYYACRKIHLLIYIDTWITADRLNIQVSYHPYNLLAIKTWHRISFGYDLGYQKTVIKLSDDLVHNINLISVHRCIETFDSKRSLALKRSSNTQWKIFKLKLLLIFLMVELSLKLGQCLISNHLMDVR